MSIIATPILDPAFVMDDVKGSGPDSAMRRLLGSTRVVLGGGLLAVIVITCLVTLPLTLRDTSSHGQKNSFYFDQQHADIARNSPSMQSPSRWLGTDIMGRSLLSRCLLGGAISLGIGVSSAALSVFLGVSVGLIAGYRGGWIDSLLMRSVDVLYGLPYVLLIILLKIALEPTLVEVGLPTATANLLVLFLAIGLVSWLTMARVVCADKS